MHSPLRKHTGRPRLAPATWLIAALSALTLASGCSLSPMAKQVKAFSSATTTVVTGSKDAYREANRLRVHEQVEAAVVDYDKNPTWSPYTNMEPLLTSEQLEARLKVLNGLKAYATTLVHLTGAPEGKDKRDLDAAAKGAGSSLQGLDASVSKSFGTALVKIPAMSDDAAHGASTAIRALGEYLMARKVQKSLPSVVKEMNPTVQTLCQLLQSDVRVLRRQADVDYQQLVTNEDSFIRHAGSQLTPSEHRAEVGKLIEIANAQKGNDELLAQLDKSISAWAQAHQALTEAAEGKSTETLTQKIAELEAAGQELGDYYGSLSKPAVATTK